MICAKLKAKPSKLPLIRMIVVAVSISGLHPMSAAIAEVTVDSIDLLVDEAEEAGELHWWECEFNLSKVHHGDATQDLSHNGYWIELALSTGESGYAELDLLLLDEGVSFRQLFEGEDIPLDQIQRIPIRGNRTFQLDISSTVSTGLGSGIMEYRFALGRLDATSLGMIELLSGGDNQSGRVIAVQTN